MSSPMILALIGIAWLAAMIVLLVACHRLVTRTHRMEKDRRDRGGNQGTWR